MAATITLPRELEEEFEELAARFAEEVQKGCTTQAEIAKATADMIDCVSGYVGYEMSLAAREINSSSPLLAVNPPPDIFGHVCQYLTLSERITVTGVCHYWRKLAIADARLWNHIAQSYPDSTGARELLERSRNTPVHLELTIFDQNVDAVGVFLTEHLHHVKTLILRMAESRSGKGNSNAWNTINYALCRPAPVLETLYLNMQRSAYNPMGSEDACTLRPDFLAGIAPVLREVSLSGVLPPSHTNEPIAPFGPVETLMYTHSNGQSLTETELKILVENFPRLQTLCLSAQQYTDNAEATVRRLPNLRVIDCVLGQGGDHALRRLHYDHVALVCVRQNFHHHDVMPVLRTENARVEGLAVTMADMMLQARKEDNELQERRFFGLSSEQISAALVDADNFRHLASLTLHEFMWPQTGTLPAAPLLRSLTVLLATTAEHRQWGAGNAHAPMMMPNMGGGVPGEPTGKLTIFHLPMELPAPWNCGSLRDFTLAFGGSAWAKPAGSEAERVPRVIAATDLLGFVQTHLATALPLSKLELRGVELLEAPYELPAFNGLLANCSEFIVGPPGADPSPQSTGLWETFYSRSRSHDRRRRH